MLHCPHDYYYKSHCKGPGQGKAINWSHQCRGSATLVDWSSSVMLPWKNVGFSCSGGQGEWTNGWGAPASCTATGLAPWVRTGTLCPGGGWPALKQALLTCGVSMGTLLHFSKPRFPHMQIEMIITVLHFWGCRSKWGTRTLAGTQKILGIMRSAWLTFQVLFFTQIKQFIFSTI